MLPALSLLCQTPIVPHTQANASRVASQGTQCSGAVGSTDQARRGGLRCGFQRRHLCTAVGWRGCRSAAGLRLTQLRSRPAVCQIESTATRCPFEVCPSEHQVRRCVSLIKSNTPGEIRTHDLRIRNPDKACNQGSDRLHTAAFTGQTKWRLSLYVRLKRQRGELGGEWRRGLVRLVRSSALVVAQTSHVSMEDINVALEPAIVFSNEFRVPFNPHALRPVIMVDVHEAEPFVPPNNFPVEG